MNTSTLTVLFADMVESSRRMTDLGDGRGDAFMAKFVHTLDDVVVRHGGRTVKHLGDGVMAVFERSALDGVRASWALHAAATALHPDDPPLVRVGISLGEVTVTSGDFYGRPVVEAARLCGVAESGTTLVSPLVRSVIGDRDGFEFVDVGPLDLKGLAGQMTAGRLLAPVEFESSVGDDGPEDQRLTAGGRRNGGRRSRRTVAAVSVVVALAAAAGWLGSTWEDNEPATVSTDRRPERASAPKDYRPVLTKAECDKNLGDGVLCFVLRVPEDRSRPAGQQVEIPVGDYPPLSGAAPKGVPVVETAKVEPTATSPLRTTRRMITFGRRGVVGTPVLNCPEQMAAGQANLLKPILSAEAVQTTLEAVKACRDRWTDAGIDVSAYDTQDVVLDLRDLIVAMDLDQIDLVVDHISTAVAFGAVKDFPGSIRTLTVQNPVPTDVSPGDYTRSFAAAFDRLGAQCAVQERCNEVVPSLSEAWRRTYDGLQLTPQVVTGPLPDGTMTSILLDGDRTALALYIALGVPDLRVFVPDLLSRPSLPEIGYNARDRSDVRDLPYGATLSDNCHRIAPNERPVDGAVMTRLPQFRSGLFKLLPESCKVWDVPEPEPEFFEPTRSDVPVLIVHGMLAGDTDIAWVDRVAAGFPNASVVSFPTLGFGPLQEAPRCLAQLREGFHDDPTVPLDPSEIDSCVASVPPVGFVVG